MKNGLYSIGEIGKLCVLPLSKLRYWDEKGIIAPAYVDQETGYRYYNEETLLQISLLKYYRNCGFKLKEIENLLQCMDLDHLEPLFDRHIANLDREIAYLSIQRDSISAWRELIHEERRTVEHRDFSVHKAYFTPTLLYVSTPYTWENMPYETLIANIELCNHLTVIGNSTVGPLYLYFPHGDRTEFGSSRIYIRPHPLEEPMTEQETVGGYAALTVYHSGSFETCTEAYRKTDEYAAAHGLSFTGESFERSVIDWWSTKKENEFLIEVIRPLSTPPAEDLPHRSF